MPDANTYTVGWICAIQPEYVAAQSFLDEKHDRPDYVSTNDDNIYTLGRIGKHNVVIGVLPDGEYGIASAVSVANSMRISFPNIRIGLMVGIGGGAPSTKHDIRLGDVVVSAPRDRHGGVLQYDFGKTIQGQAFQMTGFLNQSPELLRAAIADIRTEHEMDGHQLEQAVSDVLDKRPRLRQKYQRPDDTSDRLFQSGFVHPVSERTNCTTECSQDPSRLVQRPIRAGGEDNPAIHYGTIASANQLMEDAHVRDKLAAEHDVLCFEMEAAGLMNRFPCIVIRGICDYSDSHKNKDWQGYAAMVAAAYAKDLLRRIPPNRIEAERRISAVLDSINGYMDEVRTGVTNTADKVENVLNSLRLDKLSIAASASFDSSDEEHKPKCLPNTRVDLLQQIKKWALDPSTKPIFWLNGKAGTGKSTICRSVARSFTELGHLGASFFFKRGEADRGSLSKFVTTIAVQLVQRRPTVTPYIQNAIDDDLYIAGKSIRYQFNKLIIQPLSSISTTWGPEPLIFVIDALDECDGDEDIKVLITLFSSMPDALSSRLRIMITSRPDLPIRLGFQAATGTYQDLVLHEIPLGIVEHDIATFLRHELHIIKMEWNASVLHHRHLPADWPGEDIVQHLTEMAIPLFIFAATICRFVADRKLGNPRKQLGDILGVGEQANMSPLDRTYLPVLNRLTDGLQNEQQVKIIKRFQCIVGTIVLLGNPLPIAALGRLLDIHREEIDDLLDHLHSVLSIPGSEEAPVRIFHLSFHDFLVTSDHYRHPFRVDKKHIHTHLTWCCLDVMKKNLRMDICKVKQPGTERAAICSDTISRYIKPELQYACFYWVYHIREAGLRVNEDSSVYEFLQTYFLYWLEALCWTGRITESLILLKGLQECYTPQDSQALVNFLKDAERFIQTNIATARSWPLQIYSSILAFTPKNSIIRKELFQINQVPEWISLLPEPEDDWDLCKQILEGHSGEATAIAFSPDGATIASASRDKTVRLWHAADGACIQQLKGHHSLVTAVAFSPDGATIASASDDKTVRLWHAANGACIQQLKGHCHQVTAVAFSPDGATIASASCDITVRLWRTADGACIQQLKGHHNLVTAIAFSPDGATIASASCDKTVRLWHAADGACIQQLKGHHSWVTAVAFSPDSATIASASRDKTVRLWHAADGACIQQLKGHCDQVTAVAFSPDGATIASGSGDKTVQLWRAADGACIQQLKGHHDQVTAVAFSPDGATIASASDDMTVRLWRTADDACIQQLKGHHSLVTAVAFSPDGATIASASDDKTVRLWRAADGACIQQLKGHYSQVTAVAFSPDGATIASASGDMIVRLWRTADGACIQQLKGHRDQVTAVAFSPDGATIASGSGDNKVRLWHAADGACIQQLKGHRSWVTAVAFSPDGATIASASRDKTVRLWHAADGACIQQLKGHHDRVTAVAFSPDGATIASGSGDKTVRLWHAADGACIQQLKGHHNWVTAVAFSPDGATIASASGDKTVRLWRAADGNSLQELTGISSHRLQFDKQGLYLWTDAGAISIYSPILLSNLTEPNKLPFYDSLSGIGITHDGCWIMWRNTKLLWLPPSFRPTCCCVDGLSVIIGCNSGRVIFMRFDPSRLHSA